jgi:hypothetical protein
MEKNWLIRTKSNQIRGPITKDKVLELFHNGSIKPEDEICTGNGFWFFLREEDMVKRYLLGNELQSFNPMSEAKDVLTATPEAPAPAEEEDITLVGAVNLNMLNDPPPAAPAPPVSPAAAAVAPKATEKAPAEAAPAREGTKKKIRAESRVKAQASAARRAEKPQNYLQIFFIFIFMLLLLIVYYRKTIIHSLFDGEVTVLQLLVPQAHAQEEAPEKKKS